MRFKDCFVLDWHAFLFDLVVFILGIFFSSFSKLIYACEGSYNCVPIVIVYIGLVLIFSPLIHFLMTVIAFFVDKICSRKKSCRKKKKR